MSIFKNPKIVVLIVTILVLGGWHYATAPSAAQIALSNVRIWDYQLQNANLDRLAQASSDMVVIDYARSWGDKVPYSRADVERVRRRPDGRERLVIAYLSIGEAEDYRPYWQPGWKQNRPLWLLPQPRSRCGSPCEFHGRAWPVSPLDRCENGPGLAASYLKMNNSPTGGRDISIRSSAMTLAQASTRVALSGHSIHE